MLNVCAPQSAAATRQAVRRRVLYGTWGASLVNPLWETLRSHSGNAAVPTHFFLHGNRCFPAAETLWLRNTLFFSETPLIADMLRVFGSPTKGGGGVI